MDLTTLLKYSGQEKDVSESRMSDIDIDAQDNSKEDFIKMHSSTLGSDEEAGKFWEDSKEANEGIETEAVGSFADPILDLCDEVGCDPDHPIFADLIRYLDGDTIADFVKEFRSNHEYDNGMEYESVEEPVEEEIVSELIQQNDQPIMFKDKEVDMNKLDYDMDDISDQMFTVNAPVFYTDGTEVDDADMAELEEMEEFHNWVIQNYMDTGGGVSEASEELEVQETVEVAVNDLASLMSLAGLEHTPQATTELDEYSNSPDEDYMDADMQLNKLSGGLNRPKAQMHNKDGDNPLAAKLAQQLKDLMSK